MVQLLSQRINQIVQQPALKARFETEGTLVKSYTPQEVDALSARKSPNTGNWSEALPY